MRYRRYRAILATNSPLPKIILGILCGFFGSMWLRNERFPTIRDFKSCQEKPSRRLGENFLYVGVMTAKKYISTRVVAVNNTWARTIPGRVTFFSSFDSNSSDRTLPLVSLPGVDDTYPPQKKAFLMLKYMHDKYINDFEWFMRTDDDVYIKGDRIEQFLRPINSSRALYIGQAGQGSKDEFGRLYLDPGDNYCMGGTGMIFSRETLKRMVPNISACLKNLYTTHEDVEVGRCVRKYANINCTWSYEMSQLLYQNYSSNDAFKGNIRMPEVHRAIALHPIKTTHNLYRMHRYLEEKKISELNQKTARLKRNIRNMDLLLKEKSPRVNCSYTHCFFPDSHEQSIPWEFFSSKVYSPWKRMFSKYRIREAYKSSMSNMLSAYVELLNNGFFLNENSFQRLLYGYRTVVPGFGVSFILDGLFNHKSRIHAQWQNKEERRHFHLHQAFGNVEFTEVSLNGMDGGVKDSDSSNQLHTAKTVNFIVPLSGRIETFKTFMDNFEHGCLKYDHNIALAVVVFNDDKTNSSKEPILVLERYQQKYPNVDIRVVLSKGTFSRGRALELGVAQYPDDALLFFLDVDLQISSGLVRRCRRNAVRSRQVYYPGMFSLFDPNVVYFNKSSTQKSKTIQIAKETGFFRDFSYGMVCTYKSDYRNVGGFDLDIKGWGNEDLDLYEKFVRSNLTVFRVLDIELIHTYHPKYCDSNLSTTQYNMCLGSKNMIVANTEQLYRLVKKTRHKLQKKQ
ncbi:chondroitin sulfate synthase 3-like [Saccoglossus kowalevskii]